MANSNSHKMMMKTGFSSARTEIQSPLTQLAQVEKHEYLTWKGSFMKFIQKTAKSYDKYPGHGAGLLDMHDMFNKANLESFIQGIEKIIWNEIGQPKTHFDQIITLEA